MDEVKVKPPTPKVEDKPKVPQLKRKESLHSRYMIKRQKTITDEMRFNQHKQALEAYEKQQQAMKDILLKNIPKEFQPRNRIVSASLNSKATATSLAGEAQKFHHHCGPDPDHTQGTQETHETLERRRNSAFFVSPKEKSR